MRGDQMPRPFAPEFGTPAEAMDARPDHGGAAFPKFDSSGWGCSGMTLRQYYKAALAPTLVVRAYTGGWPTKHGDWRDIVAQLAGELADAMLAEDAAFAAKAGQS